MAEQDKTSKVITLDDKKYNLDELSEEIQNDIRGLQICDSQLRLYQDTLKLLSVSRKTIVNQLKEKMKDIQPIE